MKLMKEVINTYVVKVIYSYKAEDTHIFFKLHDYLRRYDKEGVTSKCQNIQRLYSSIILKNPLKVKSQRLLLI